MLHIVKRGDSLWRLAVRFQGSGTQWPKLVKHHNEAVARSGPNSGLLTIKDPNLIFIGQTLNLPPRAKCIELGPGEKCDADKPPKDVDLPVQYVIGHNTPPCVWLSQSPDWDIKVELKGDITVEMTSESRHRHNLKILLSKDSTDVELRLRELYDPVISKLLSPPSVKFESGKVKIETPIATEANLGPYSIEVQPLAPNHFSGIIRPETVSATTKADGLDYKYSADIEFKADVNWHARPRTVPESVAETVKDRASQTKMVDLDRPTGHTTKWEQTVNEKGVVVAVALVIITAAAAVLYRMATRGGVGFKPAPNGSIMTPFTHTINRHKLEA